MAHADATRRRGIRGLADQANPAFAAAAVLVPVGALAGVLFAGDLRLLNYVHVLSGGLWTGIDLFMGALLGPVLGGMDPEARADFFRRFTPKMTFLMPVLSLVTIVAGITLARRLGYFPAADPWLALMTAAILVPVVVLVGYQFDALASPRTLGVLAVVVLGSGAWMATTYGALVSPGPLVLAALAVVTLLSVIGTGIILPGEVKIYREAASPDPDIEAIGRIGMRNAKLGGLQGLLQLSIVFVMASFRFGL